MEGLPSNGSSFSVSVTSLLSFFGSPVGEGLLELAGVEATPFPFATGTGEGDAIPLLASRTAPFVGVAGVRAARVQLTAPSSKL